jgi:hypothetical protein
MIIRNGLNGREILLTAGTMRPCKSDAWSVSAIVDGLTPAGQPATFVVVLSIDEIAALHRIANPE